MQLIPDSIFFPVRMRSSHIRTRTRLRLENVYKMFSILLTRVLSPFGVLAERPRRPGRQVKPCGVSPNRWFSFLNKTLVFYCLARLFLLQFFLKSLKFTLFVLLSLDHFSLSQFFRVHSTLNRVKILQLAVLLRCETWNLQFFSLIFQTVLVHVVYIRYCELWTWSIYTFLHITSDSFPYKHFIQNIKDCWSLGWLYW